MLRRSLLLAAALAPLAAQAGELELNRASRAELESLPGVGPELAARLLGAREQALFSDWVDLRRRVRGIGPATARKLSAHGLRVQGRPYEDAAAPG